MGKNDCPICGWDCKKDLVKNQVDLEPDFCEAVDRNFWELTAPEESAAYHPPERPEEV